MFRLKKVIFYIETNDCLWSYLPLHIIKGEPECKFCFCSSILLSVGIFTEAVN